MLVPLHTFLPHLPSHTFILLFPKVGRVSTSMSKTFWQFCKGFEIVSSYLYHCKADFYIPLTKPVQKKYTPDNINATVALQIQIFSSRSVLIPFSLSGTEHCSDESTARTSHGTLTGRISDGRTQLIVPKVWSLRIIDCKHWCVY